MAYSHEVPEGAVVCTIDELLAGNVPDGLVAIRLDSDEDRVKLALIRELAPGALTEPE